MSADGSKEDYFFAGLVVGCQAYVLTLLCLVVIAEDVPIPVVEHIFVLSALIYALAVCVGALVIGYKRSKKKP